MPERRRTGTAIAAVAATAMAGIVALNLMPDRRELRGPVPTAVTLSSPDFERMLAGLFGSNLIAGNRIETLVNGDAIIPAMLAAIEAAERTINLARIIHDACIDGPDAMSSAVH